MFNEASIQNLLRQGQAQGVFSKAVAGFVLPDGSYHTATLDTDADTIFDIASLTKVCPTSTLALCAILQGKLDVDTKVTDFIPELHTNYRDDIRIFHLKDKLALIVGISCCNWHFSSKYYSFQICHT